jgi:large repetitive protein
MQAIRIPQTIKGSNIFPKMKVWASALLVLICVFGCIKSVQAQCGSTVPSYTVNLSNNDDSTWTSASVSRAGNCCLTTSPVNCINFSVTLAPTAAGIIFNLSGGAGGTTYFINCVSGGRAGSPQCLSGSGPWSISFCKSGTNPSIYTIQSVPKPYVPKKSVYVTSKCKATLSVKGLDKSTITWTSIGGSYNSYLSCTSGCDTTYVTAGSGFPSYVDYKVCGTPLLSCYSAYCDTIRVYYTSPLLASISPKPGSICYTGTTTTETVTASGSRSPYTYLWNTGDTTNSITVGTGTYYVKVLDSFGCSPVYDTVVVTKAAQIKANAGGNGSMCTSASRYTLNGSVQTATGGIWSGGTGSFSPNNATLFASYIPSASEIAAGFAKLYLTTTGNNGCSAVKDSMILTINPIPAASVISDTIICTGNSVRIGSASISGHTYSWSSAPSGFASTAANPQVNPAISTIYDLTETITATGCSNTNSVTITVNPLPVAGTISNTGICTGTSISIGASAVSGSTYSWTSSPAGFSSSSANPGVSPTVTTTYTVTETNANGCVKSNSVTITVNPLPNPSISGNIAPCEYSKGEVYSTANVSGDSYLWSVSGGTLSSGQGSHSILVDWGAAGTGTVSLTETIPGTGCSKSVSLNTALYSKPGSKTIIHH